MSRRRAAVLAGLAILLGLASEHVRQVWLQPLWVPLTDLAIGWLLVGCGLIASVARPQQVAGRRIVLAGFLWIVAAPRQWFADTGQTDDWIQIDALSFAFVGWSDAVLAAVALSFAERWPRRRRERLMIVALAAAFAFQTVIRLLLRGPEILNRDLVAQDTILPLVALANLAVLMLLAVAGLVIIGRYVAARPPSRRLLGPVLLAGAVACLAPLYGAWYPLANLGFMDPLPPDVAVPAAWVVNAARVLVPIAMLVGILRQRGSRGAIADAIAAMGHAPSSAALEAALGGALRDPSLRLLTWDEHGGGYVDAGGQPAVLPDSGPTTVTTLVPAADGAHPLAALVHDRALAEDPTLVAAGVAVTRLVIDNQHLTRELQHQLDEVRASRARIVEAGDAERRRIERDLHDGVQQRLLALALALRRAGSKAADPVAADALARGADEALRTVDDVRELAQGIHPAILTEAGLGAALRALAERSPVPVDVHVELPGDESPTTAAVGYFVASEALANVVKHAGATAVILRAAETDGAITVAVEDDGHGHADPNGAGLRGLDDRVAAIGGTLVVADRTGGGTVVAATIPVAPAPAT